MAESCLLHWPRPRGAGATGAAGATAPLALCSRGQRGQLCPRFIESDVRNVINESELIVDGRHWSF